ncbi:MAG: hypothetical protein WC586_11840 [Methanoregula sp.]
MKLRSIGVVLLLLMAAMAMVPMVSAEELYNGAINPPNEIKKELTMDELRDAPVHPPKIYDLQSLADRKSTPQVNDREKKFILVIIPQKDIKTTIDGSAGLISVTVPKSSARFINQKSGSKAPIPDLSLAGPVQTEGPVSVLWAPSHMVEISENGDLMTILFPQDLLMKYSDLNEARERTVSSRDNNLQIYSDTIPSAESQQISSTIRASDFQERSWYKDNNCAHHINGITGKIYPSGSYNNGESYFSYHEMEIYLSRYPYSTTLDTAEVISFHRTDNQKRAFFALWDEGTSYTMLDIDVTNKPYVEYYFYIENSAGWIYWMHFRDPSTGTWYSSSYNDSDNPSYYVRDLRGSTELLSLQHVPPLFSFRTQTSPIRVDYTRTTTGWFTPSQTVTWNYYTANQQYVDTWAWWNSNGGIDTTHYCGSGIT